MQTCLNHLRAQGDVMEIVQRLQALSCMPGLDQWGERLINSMTAHAFVLSLHLGTLNGVAPTPELEAVCEGPMLYLRFLLGGPEDPGPEPVQ